MSRDRERRIPRAEQVHVALDRAARVGLAAEHARRVAERRAEQLERRRRRDHLHVRRRVQRVVGVDREQRLAGARVGDVEAGHAARSGPRSSFSICLAMSSSSVSGSSRRPTISRVGRSSPAERVRDARGVALGGLGLRRGLAGLPRLAARLQLRHVCARLLALDARRDRLARARLRGAASTGAAIATARARARAASTRFIAHLAASRTSRLRRRRRAPPMRTRERTPRAGPSSSCRTASRSGAPCSECVPLPWITRTQRRPSRCDSSEELSQLCERGRDQSAVKVERRLRADLAGTKLGDLRVRDARRRARRSAARRHRPSSFTSGGSSTTLHERRWRRRNVHSIARRRAA